MDHCGRLRLPLSPPSWWSEEPPHFEEAKKIARVESETHHPTLKKAKCKKNTMECKYQNSQLLYEIHYIGGTAVISP